MGERHYEERDSITEASPPDWGRDAKRHIMPYNLRELRRGRTPTPKCWKHPVLSAPLQKYNGNQMNESSVGRRGRGQRLKGTRGQ